MLSGYTGGTERGIGGAWQSSSTDARVTVINPSDETVLTELPGHVLTHGCQA